MFSLKRVSQATRSTYPPDKIYSKSSAILKSSIPWVKSKKKKTDRELEYNLQFTLPTKSD